MAKRVEGDRGTSARKMGIRSHMTRGTMSAERMFEAFGKGALLRTLNWFMKGHERVWSAVRMDQNGNLTINVDVSGVTAEAARTFSAAVVGKYSRHSADSMEAALALMHLQICVERQNTLERDAALADAKKVVKALMVATEPEPGIDDAGFCETCGAFQKDEM